MTIIIGAIIYVECSVGSKVHVKLFPLHSPIWILVTAQELAINIIILSEETGGFERIRDLPWSQDLEMAGLGIAPGVSEASS